MITYRDVGEFHPHQNPSQKNGFWYKWKHCHYGSRSSYWGQSNIQGKYCNESWCEIFRNDPLTELLLHRSREVIPSGLVNKQIHRGKYFTGSDAEWDPSLQQHRCTLMKEKGGGRLYWTGSDTSRRFWSEFMEALPDSMVHSGVLTEQNELSAYHSYRSYFDLRLPYSIYSVSLCLAWVDLGLKPFKPA